MTAPPPSLRGAEDDYRDFYDYVSLAGELEAFDLTAVISGRESADRRTYYGRAGTDRENANLYRTADGRWVLLFVEMEGREHGNGPVDRELAPAQAARWLRLNRNRPPRGLAPAPSAVDEAGERRGGDNRLDRDWVPRRADPTDGPIPRPPSSPDTRKQPGEATGSRVRGGLDARAFACLVAHPGWTNKRIADMLDCHAKSLSRLRLFNVAKRALRAGRDELPRGSKTIATRHIESWANDGAER